MQILSQSYPQSDSLPIIKSFFLQRARRLRKSGINTMTQRISSESKDEMSDCSHAEILVVDDDALSRRVLAQLLRIAGYNLVWCKHGSKPGDTITLAPPSLLILI